MLTRRRDGSNVPNVPFRCQYKPHAQNSQGHKTNLPRTNKQIAISLSYNISPSSAFLPLLHDPGGKLREFYREPDVGNATLAQSKGRLPTLFIFETLVVSVAATVALAEIVGYGRVAPIVKAHLEYTAVAIAVCRCR